MPASQDTPYSSGESSWGGTSGKRGALKMEPCMCSAKRRMLVWRFRRDVYPPLLRLWWVRASSISVENGTIWNLQPWFKASVVLQHSTLKCTTEEV